MLIHHSARSILVDRWLARNCQEIGHCSASHVVQLLSFLLNRIRFLASAFVLVLKCEVSRHCRHFVILTPSVIRYWY